MAIFNTSSDKPLWQQWLNRGLLAALVVSACALAILLFNFLKLNNLLEQLELLTYDVRVNMPLHTGTSKDQPSKDIVMLQFDEATFQYYNDKIGSWPWPRSLHADMIKYMNAHGARAMAYDLMFIGQQRGREASDQYFVETFAAAPNVYFSMNFDNDLAMLQKRGKNLTAEDIRLIQPYAVNLENRLDPKNKNLILDESGFYANSAMNFNNYKKIMEGLMGAGDRIAFINHGPDPDGISRGNPLIYRFKYSTPVKSPYRPYGQDPDTQGWFDTQNRPVTRDGFYLDAQGHYLSEQHYLYYPYLAMRLFIDLKFPGEKVKFTLTPDGFLAFKNYRVPLTRGGIFLPRWYQVNIDRPQLEAQLNDLTTHNGSPSEIMRLKAALSRPKPYTELPAWQLLDAMYHVKEGKPLTATDRQVEQLLKDKVIFIGNTSVSGYDIKPTPIDKLMPGVFIQAATFDSLWRNDGFVRRINPLFQMLLTGFLCLLAVCLVFKFRTVLLEFISVISVILVYVLGACVLFKFGDFWLEIVTPIFMVLTCGALATGVKYFMRNQDYEKAYAQANTDSMTGLYNYNFFKKHMGNSIDRARQFNLSFGLVLIDIDFFKKFNDTHGHQAGDEVLRCVARKLKEQVRTVDVVCRYGGEEMAVILDGADNEASLRVADKLVKAIAEEAYPIAEGVAKHVTISCGVATYPQHGKTTAELVEFSDKGLYNAKEHGRNQVGAQPDTAPGEAFA